MRGSVNLPGVSLDELEQTVSAHNTSTEAHTDIRKLVSAAQTAANNAASAAAAAKNTASGKANADMSNVDMTALATALGGADASSLATLAASLGGAKIATGSYTGTGTYGSGNPNSLTFDFVPKIVFIMPHEADYGLGTFHPFIHGAYKSPASYNGSLASCNVLTWNDKTVSWYCESGNSTGSPSMQCNTQNKTYRWVAFS